MWIIQSEVSYENNVTNKSTEPNVERSLYVSNISVKNTDNTEETLFLGQKACEKLVEMKTPEIISFFTWVRYNRFFKNGVTYTLPYRATDHRYWEAMKFTFIQGKPYSQEDVEKARPVIVISNSLSEQSFGKGNCALGKRITLEGKDYIVCGVVKDVPTSSAYAFGEYWIPYTVWAGMPLSSNPLLGIYLVQIVAKSPQDFDIIHKEYNSYIQQLDKEYKSHCVITKTSFGTKDYLLHSSSKTNERCTLSLSDCLKHYLETFWFILIPSLALMCINFARTSERGSEVGVRMALGANKNMIRLQFIKENAIIILIGMLLGSLVGYVCIYQWPNQYLNGLDAYKYVALELPYTLTILSHLILTFIVFICASTVIPIYKIKKQMIVSLLKGEEL